MAGASAKERRERAQAELRERLARLDEELAAAAAFSATFVGPPKPPKEGSLARALQMLLSPSPADRRALGLDHPHLPSAQARELSRKRWHAHDVAKEEALRFAAALNVEHRIDAARAIVSFLKGRGWSITEGTADAWLKQSHWARGVHAVHTPQHASHTT